MDSLFYLVPMVEKTQTLAQAEGENCQSAVRKAGNPDDERRRVEAGSRKFSEKIYRDGVRKLYHKKCLHFFVNERRSRRRCPFINSNLTFPTLSITVIWPTCKSRDRLWGVIIPRKQQR